MQVTSDRFAGVLLHPTSLPGIYGIGDLGDQVIAFLDWASTAGMRIWQVLPLNPPGYGASPYGCLSSFAGNPLMISPQRLLQEEILTAEDVADVPRFPDERVDFEPVSEYKFKLLRRAWQRFQRESPRELHDALETFIGAGEQRGWLDEYALYMALKEEAGGAPWWDWQPELIARNVEALDDARATHAEAIRFWHFVQFLFFRQWAAVREAARVRGIRIMGDLPIYVASDSADVWANQELFHLDDRGCATVVAGVPPDYFSADGQRWGNPLYRWDVMAESGYRWWIDRVRANLRFADSVRIDHFRGFAAYWEIPAEEPTAVHGRWMPGPGLRFFDALREEFAPLPLVAEDLGFITEDVHELRRAVGVPGMRVLQFGFAQPDSPHLPHRYEADLVVYTGTHDNDTARGWLDDATPEERDAAETYLGCRDEADLVQAMIRAAYVSVASIAIVPVQDVLGLGSEARMNRPGASDNNWNWRLYPGALTQDHAVALRKLAVLAGRV